MKKTINQYDLRNAFVAHDRDYFSNEACEALLDWYDDIDENMELDVIAICCEWSEYTGDGLMDEYGYLLDEDEVEDAEVSDLVGLLEYHTTVIELSNSYLVIAY